VAQPPPDVHPVPTARPAPDDRSGPAAGGAAGEVLAGHLAGLAAEFLRALRGREPGEDEAAGTAALRAAARRIAATAHTYEPLLDPGWAQQLRTELTWLGAVVGREHRHAARLARLTAALHRLAAGRDGTDGSALNQAVGAARAGALLERQLTLARTRAHSATLQALGSARFHAVADAVALLTSDVPLTAAAGRSAGRALPPLATQACRALTDAVGALPLTVAANPYNTHALHASLGEAAGPEAGQDGDPRDLPWHRVRRLVRTCRYALEVPGAAAPPDPDRPPRPDLSACPERLFDAGRVLERHREAAEAAEAAATAARTPRITPATAYALGVLHADQRAEVEAARYAFSTLWRPVAPAPAP
jgi:CHAD domain